MAVPGGPGGQFGSSFFYQRPAGEVLLPMIINTAWIAIPGILLGATFAIGGEAVGLVGDRGVDLAGARVDRKSVG